MFPAGSTAATAIWCDPGATVKVGDAAHAANDAPSSEQRNVEPVSVDWNVNGALVSVVEAGGVLVIDVSGAVTSIVH